MMTFKSTAYSSDILERGDLRENDKVGLEVLEKDIIFIEHLIY